MTVGQVVGAAFLFIFIWVRILHPIYLIMTGEEQ
jgi:hypothetical protein